MYYSETNNMLEMPAWLSSYLNGTHHHDEVEHHSGGDTQHWDVLFARLANLSDKDIHLRSNEIKRLLQDSGVTFGMKNQTSWRLDPLPLMLSENDWQVIKAGVIQRTELLNKIANDLYGHQELLLNGLLSASQLKASSSYLRECYSFTGTEQKIFVAAYDIYRDKDGHFKVLDDHLQAPQGLGLLLENRIIARRVMGDEFAECNVQRIANFFNKIQDSINDLTPSLRDPRVVILTKGSDDPFYSEHAFLSAYLGSTLVRSADLTVRKGKVWLKSLKGLRKVDVIVRWIDDSGLDSLEQNAYSMDGIPGLFQAVRNQTVKVINPVGCGILESACVKTNINRIAQYFLSEPLILTSPECLPAHLNLQLDTTNYELLSYTDKKVCLDGEQQTVEIQDCLQDNPQDYYFRQKPQLSTAPFWDDHNLTALPVIIRCFALVTANGVEVLPSALCCFSQNTQQRLASGWIKDTWIRSKKPESHANKFPKLTKKMSDLALLDGVIPSRTAENLFWLGRYLERGENTVRMLRLLIDRFTEFSIYPDSNNQKIVTKLVEAIVNQSIVPPYIHANNTNDSQSYIPREIAAQLFADSQFSGSLLCTLKALTNSALQVRELLSSDSWRIIDDIRDEFRRIERAPASVSTRVMQATADRIIGYLMAFNGSTSDSMSNSNGWFMLDMGRRVERSTQLVSIIENLMTEQMAELEQLSMLEAILTSQVSLITHKRRYRMYQSAETSVELLILDAEYPRSLLYQIEQLNHLCKLLPNKSTPGLMAPHQKLLLKMQTICHLAERETLASATSGKRSELVDLMKSVKTSLDAFSDLLMLQYFSHTKTAVPLNSLFGSIDKS
ncbi:circularly permuted type 2 ATP-grasp protein [Catenovulum sediminis]|uniref:Circularly permuted type 2 ATP-grasp protein n=1 Tax=Catenovulum sediminis TaxID=1740262 RepID=A0ABV1RMA8_9ALTE|nr:circularly permuted type 2 ATP-grasp protein [Catenovulum sediminis]